MYSALSSHSRIVDWNLRLSMIGLPVSVAGHLVKLAIA
jgi:hypothetical protein